MDWATIRNLRRVPDHAQAQETASPRRLSQSDFAAAFGFTINQICDWEQFRSRPLGGVRAYLLLIEHDPKAVLTMLRVSGGRRASASLRSASSAR